MRIAADGGVDMVGGIEGGTEAEVVDEDAMMMQCRGSAVPKWQFKKWSSNWMTGMICPGRMITSRVCNMRRVLNDRCRSMQKRADSWNQCIVQDRQRKHGLGVPKFCQ